VTFSIWVGSRHFKLWRSAYIYRKRVCSRVSSFTTPSESSLTSLLSMAAPNILDPNLVYIFPQMPPEHQRQGVDILTAKCTEIEGAGSVDAKLALMGQSESDNKSLTEDQRKALVAGGLDQCYWQLTMFLRVRHSCIPTTIASKSTHLYVSCSIQTLHASKKRHPT
jgi:hypothetical protein